MVEVDARLEFISLWGGRFRPVTKELGTDYHTNQEWNYKEWNYRSG